MSKRGLALMLALLLTALIGVPVFLFLLARDSRPRR